MGGACGTYGGDVECVQVCRQETERKETTFKNQA
jgi:hypothetical protein